MVVGPAEVTAGAGGNNEHTGDSGVCNGDNGEQRRGSIQVILNV